jgi:CheY-like chemotaxis protein
MVWPSRNRLKATYELSHIPTPARHPALSRKIKHIAGRIVNLDRQTCDQEELRSVLELVLPQSTQSHEDFLSPPERNSIDRQEVDPGVISSASSPRILVLDDEEAIVDLIVAVLRGAGFTVIGTQSPFEAIAICEDSQARIDLVLCDVHMPGLKGTQFADKVRNIMQDARFIFMTGDVDAREDLIAKGFVCLQKPFIFSDLVCRLQGVLTSTTGLHHAD